MLRHNRCITHINLSCNEIGLVGAKARPGSLALSRSISLGSEIAQALANTMQKNKTILNINLSANPWTRMDGAQEARARVWSCSLAASFPERGWRLAEVWYRIEKWSRANQEVPQGLAVDLAGWRSFQVQAGTPVRGLVFHWR